jgi:hypothetical protein
MQPFRKALLLFFLLMTSPVFAASPPERKQGLEQIGNPEFSIPSAPGNSP